jgi:hypothetical protein
MRPLLLRIGWSVCRLIARVPVNVMRLLTTKIDMKKIAIFFMQFSVIKMSAKEAVNS